MFTYDIGTTIGQMRFLLGDTVEATASFQDEELTACYTIVQMQMGGSSIATSAGVPQDVLFYAVAAALDSVAARIATSSNGQTIQIGDFKLSGSAQVDSVREMAQRFRDAVDNMPAYAIVEQNNSSFQELQIIRNWVLRTEG
jgi:hypothetical protein